jgi:hypothetical protein
LEATSIFSQGREPGVFPYRSLCLLAYSRVLCWERDVIALFLNLHLYIKNLGMRGLDGIFYCVKSWSDNLRLFTAMPLRLNSFDFFFLVYGYIYWQLRVLNRFQPRLLHLLLPFFG